MGAATGAGTGEETDTCTVLKKGSRQTRAAARREVRGGESAGRTTHAARVADQVHVDPPPQVHAGVGHEAEYTTRRFTGSTRRHHADREP
ncbi:hypothetical protein GCM10010297_42590 [Streptomyces malachitofuscus]|nr:hypothetical protein GCM10010297_42590 [Streptomyces malachitofuscus]